MKTISKAIDAPIWLSVNALLQMRVAVINKRNSLPRFCFCKLKKEMIRMMKYKKALVAKLVRPIELLINKDVSIDENLSCSV